ncbi:MAG: NUDIX domain-containing protein [Leptospiraceae bacterium]|nr:NUDIX domain-containing protein [Leptospiraceae bacterium]
MKARRQIVVGIDVGAERKGFHLAMIDVQAREVVALAHAIDPREASAFVQRHARITNANVQSIAIDAPPRAVTAQRRIAERTLASRPYRYRMQWTPVNIPKHDAPGWMQNGESLWKEFRRGFPGVPLLETFPTAVSDRVALLNYSVPMRLFGHRENRKNYPDYIDAIMAAITAAEHLNENTTAIGSDDTLGPIHLPAQQTTHMTLSMIVRNNRILLGLKKRGFGKGYWNGFGGKIEGDETDLQSARREIEEEILTRCADLQPAGILHFSFEEDPRVIRGAVFRGSELEGRPRETNEMRPEWFPLNKIPYAKMWPDDEFWLPLLLKGEFFSGYFHFDAAHRLLYARLS